MKAGEPAGGIPGCRVLRYSLWRPSPDETEPDIGFADPRFRRRLSMVSRMTIRVLHDLLPLGEGTKIYFISLRGELARQLKINKMLIEEGDILPADFSLSVFNAPPALASMALNLTGGYSAVYPGEGNFRSALLGAAAFLKSSPSLEESPARPERLLALVYADEPLPGEYFSLVQEPPPALAFAALLSAGSPERAGSGKTGELPLPLPDAGSPEKFLAALAAGPGSAPASAGPDGRAGAC